MKKLLTVLIALSMVAGSFAAEPVANVDMVDFSGEASVKWGIDLENGHSGFLNETDINLTLQFLPDDMSKSTTGSGVWGELVLKVDGSTKVEADGVSEGASPATVFDSVTVDTAKIHVGNLYFGIQDGDFGFGDDFYYPNALNYANDDESSEAAMFVRSTATEFGYNQGLVLGYDADMFSVEASVRTKYDSGSSLTNASIDSVVVDRYMAAGETLKVSSVPSNVKYYADTTDITSSVTSENGYKPTTYVVIYKVTYSLKDASYMTDDYAVGLYAEVKPMENLRIGLGGAYGAYSAGSAYSEKEGDLSIFAGADYVMMLSETNSFVPAVTYNMYSDSQNYNNKDGKKENDAFTSQSEIGLGLAYRWGASEDSSSLIEDFFGTKTVINDADEGDDDLLPGISVFTNLNLLGKYSKDSLSRYGTFNAVTGVYSSTILTDAGRVYYTGMETKLPILVEFYSGNLEAVPGLKAYGMFHANIAPKASQASWQQYAAKTTEADKLTYLKSTLDEALQVALAVSYDIPVGDVTVTPSLGGLYRYTNAEVAKDAKVKSNASDAEAVISKTAQKFTFTDFTPVVRVDLAGAVANTTFTAEWNASSYTKQTSKIGDADQVNVYTEDNGEITFKAKIAL